MNRALLPALALFATTFAASAQDIHYNPVGVAPAAINASYTGMFNGEVRINGMYQLMYSKDNPREFETMAISADLPLYTDSNGNYLAAGLQAVSDIVPVFEHDYRNSMGVVSLAYHRLLGSKRNFEVAAGIQGGYTHKREDITEMYFGTPVRNQFVIFPVWQNVKDIQRYILNAGISFSQCVSSKLSYTIGFSGNNLNQPTDDLKRRELNALRLNENFTISAGANWNISKKIALRPAGYLQTTDRYIAIGGTDVQLNLGTGKHRTFFTHVFAGAWYHSYRQVACTIGTEFRGFRIAAAIGSRYTPPASSTNNIGCYTLQLQYIAPYNSSKRHVICDRF